MTSLTKDERLKALKKFREYGECSRCAEAKTCEKIQSGYVQDKDWEYVRDENGDRIPNCEPVDAHLRHLVERELEWIRTQESEIYRNGITIFDKHYTARDLAELLTRSPYQRYLCKTRRCAEDVECKECGKLICLHCCHWSPLLYTHPNDVYCTDCCPSCHQAKKLSRDKEVNADLQRMINDGIV